VHRPEFQAIDSDENGLIACSLPGGVKAMYVVPNFQNPQGTTLSLERRHALAEFARREEMVVVEDDPYGDLRYEGDTLRSIFEIAGGCHGPVVKVGTFSKVLSPGLRLGWVVGHRAVIEKLVQAKQSSDLHTSTLSQYVALELVKSSFLDRHLPKLTTEYKLRRDAMIGALQQWMPRTVSWNRPQGGMFLLLRVEGGHLGREIAAAALKNNVLVIPGDDFHVRGGENTVRLNFSNCSPELIRMGVERLGKIIRELSEKRGEEANNRVSFSAT
jgi:2-aminoadipate transaminase